MMNARALCSLIAAGIWSAASMVSGQSFSVSSGGPSGLVPDDIHTTLGGVLSVGIPGVGINVDALSYGRITAFEFNPAFALEFSVSPIPAPLAGLPGTDVDKESLGADSTPSTADDTDQIADIFVETGAGGNTQVVDGNAVANPLAAPATFFLIEPAKDDVDAWDNRAPPPAGGSIFFSVDATGGAVGAPADVLLSVVPATPPPFYDTAGTPGLYASAAALGLGSSDDIDALIVFDDGDLTYTGADIILFSLAPGSAFLSSMGASPGDVLISTGPGSAIGLHRSAAALGLAGTDDVNALDTTQQIIPEPGVLSAMLLGLALITAFRNQK